MTLLRVFVPFACGYFLSYLYRVVNAVIAPDLMGELGVDAADLGLLTSAYFLTFAFFQLPLGVLLDRFGPRRTEAALLMFAALGAFVFAAAGGTAGLAAGRALIGLGVSACLMAAFKAYTLWFPAEKLPFVYGCQMAVGGLGALAGTAPVEAALAFTDWRGVFVVLGGLTVAVGAALFVFVPEKDNGPERGAAIGELARGIGEVYRSPLFWRIVPMTVMTQAAFLSIQSLWAGPWLKDVAGIGRAAVAGHLLAIAAAMIAGFFLLGAAVERLQRIGIRPIAVVVSCFGAFLGVQAAIVSGWTGAALSLWVLFGFFGTSGILPYSLLAQSFPSRLGGRVITGLNFLVFIAAFLGQWGIGAVINLWPAAAEGAYAPAGYQAAFGMMLVLQAAALAWFALVTIRAGKAAA